MDEFTENDEYQMWVAGASAFNSIDDPQERLKWAILGLVAEAGEVAAEVEKSIRKHRHITEAAKDAIHMELGDVLWFLAEVANAIDSDLDTIMMDNIQKINERLGRDGAKVADQVS